jgi:hypothetical protein
MKLQKSYLASTVLACLRPGWPGLLVACNSGKVTRFNPMAWVGVRPAKGSGAGVIKADIAPEFAGQVSLGRKDAPSDDLALDFGEPQFHLIEPRAIGWGKVQVHLGIQGEEVLHDGALVGGEIIEDDVNLATGRLAGHDLV